METRNREPREAGRHSAAGIDPAVEWAAAVLGLRPEALGIGWEREREWSRVRRLDRPGGRRAWLKQVPDGLHAEAALTSILARAGVPGALPVLAAEPSEGWLLLPDGGPTLSEALGDGEADGGAALAGPWEETLRGYARLQRAAEAHVDELLAAGVPDLRPEALPELAERLVFEDAPELAHLLPLWEADAACLAASGIRPSVQHEDLHPGNVFASSLTAFDWGDASVSHPWQSLTVAVQEPWELTAQKVYLREWGRDPGDPRTAAELAAARRLGCVGRAASWARVRDAVGVPLRFGNPVAGWLARGEDW
ncbi:hypothetical protein [Galactobacter valiniphilus]|uniref:hypothetical protein n=1 Tax=Galactobacter valiniphilus TaxID=2676122 RepID=UPI003736EBB8